MHRYINFCSVNSLARLKRQFPSGAYIDQRKKAADMGGQSCTEC